jgi:hypothetical protein
MSQPATSDKWSTYYRAGAAYRRRRGGDVIRRYQQRALARDRLAMLAASGSLAALLVLAYFVLAAR